MKISAFLNDNLPVSKGSVQIPIKGLIDEYRRRYNTQKGIKGTKGKWKFDHTVYNVKETNSTIIHVKVPSDTVPGFNYDVLFQITYEPTTTKLEDCHVRIFSNSPSFVYTYAYIFYHLDLGDGQKPGMMINSISRKIPKDRLLLPGSEEKLPNEVKRKAPVVRNVLGLPLWDKSLYYAIFYLTDNVPFISIKSAQTTISEKQLFDRVRDFDHLMAERQRADRKYKDETKNVRKKINKNIRQTDLKMRKPTGSVNTIKPQRAKTAVSSKKPIKPSSSKR